MKHFMTFTLLVIAGTALHAVSPTELKKQASEELTTAKEAVSQLKSDPRVKAVATKAQESVREIMNEKDPAKKLALLKAKGGEFVQQVAQLEGALKGVTLSPKAKAALQKLIDTPEFKLLKAEWQVFKERAKAIAQEKDPKKKMGMIHEEAKRQVGRGKIALEKFKTRAKETAEKAQRGVKQFFSRSKKKPAA